MYHRAVLAMLIGMLASVSLPQSTAGASVFAHPYFEDRWHAGENVLPNFWGPLATARDGMMEVWSDENTPPRKTRLVQYFDKGRMELDQTMVTFGSLVGGMILGQMALGPITIEQCTPPKIAIAGDRDARNPTYASVASQRTDRLARTAGRTGKYPVEFYDKAGQLKTSDPLLSLFQFTGYDSGSGHNIPKVFADYRDQANRFQPKIFPGTPDRPALLYISGKDMIGSPMSEPFLESVYVNGTRLPVYIQIFTRRVLTFNAANPNPFKVEMGNVGQQYYDWWYGTDCPHAKR